MLPLVGQQLAVGRRQEDVADLEQPTRPVDRRAWLSAAALTRPGSSEVRSTDSSATIGLRQLDADRREPAALEVAGRQERQRQHLGQAEAPQQPAHLAAGLLLGRRAGRSGRQVSGRRSMRS